MSKVPWMGLLVVVGIAGCGEAVDSTPEGTLTVDWDVRPRGCSESGVEAVQIDLEYDGGTITKTRACDEGTVSIPNLRPANYRVQLWGIDAAGDTTFEAEPRTITVHGGGETTVPRMSLTARPGEMRLVWRFHNGLVCGANHVETVDFALYDTDDFRVRQRSFSCSKGSARVKKVPPGEYVVQLRAEGTESEFVGTGEVRTRRGKVAGVEVVLDYVDP